MPEVMPSWQCQIPAAFISRGGWLSMAHSLPNGEPQSLSDYTVQNREFRLKPARERILTLPPASRQGYRRQFCHQGGAGCRRGALPTEASLLPTTKLVCCKPRNTRKGRDRRDACSVFWGVHPNAQLSAGRRRVGCDRFIELDECASEIAGYGDLQQIDVLNPPKPETGSVATKSDKRQVRGLVEGLEYRAHRGPAIRETEIQSVRDFLSERGFSQASDYFHRLTHLANRLQGRTGEALSAPAKRNYGGEAAGRHMQVQSVFDHVILSTCYAGDFNGGSGRVKVSHRFNQEGRIDFVELKFLRSLHPPLNGELRKLLLIKEYQAIRKNWLEAEAVVLRIMPRELVFLHEEIFKSQKQEMLAWLLNIGHGIVDDLLKDLQSRRVNGSTTVYAASYAGWIESSRSDDVDAGAQRRSQWLPSGRNGKVVKGNSGDGHQHADYPTHERASQGTIDGEGEDTNGRSSPAIRNADQFPLEALLDDEVALPILEKAATLESVVKFTGPSEVIVRYVRRGF